jgi:carbonic anhydrase
MLACPQARMVRLRLLGLQLGDAHIIRNAGGVASDDAIRSLAVSQWVADTREILPLHHNDCATTRFHDQEPAARMEADTGRRPPMSHLAFPDEVEQLKASMHVVRWSPLRRDPDLVAGILQDVGTGLVEEVNSPGAQIAPLPLRGDWGGPGGGVDEPPPLYPEVPPRSGVLHLSPAHG